LGTGLLRFVFGFGLFISTIAQAELALADLRAIVITDDAVPSEQYAAEELQWIIEYAAGVSLPIVHNPPRSPSVYLGPGAVDFKTNRMDGEQFRVVVSRKGIAIAGGRPRGTLYGVYDFAERHFGVRFLTRDHTHIPAPPVALPDTDYVYAPPFAMRYCFSKELTHHPVFSTRLRNNGLDRPPRLGGKRPHVLLEHTMHQYVPVEKYGDDHPEYFALFDGEHALSVPGGGPQVNPTHPDVQDIVTEAVKEALLANPELGAISVSPNDNDWYDESPRNALIDRREGTHMGQHLVLVNEVARRLARYFPDKRFGTLAYWWTRTPPQRMPVHPNVRIQFATFEATGAYALDDDRSIRNRAVIADLRRWLDLTSDVWLWHYATNLRHVDLPYGNLRTLDDDLRLFRDLGVRGLFVQLNGRSYAGEFADLKSYVISRLMWEPTLDGNALANEFLELHYGPSADSIRAALDLTHDIAITQGYEPTFWSTAEENGYDLNAALRLYEYMQEAIALAPDDVHRRRVEKIAIGAYKALIETTGALHYDDGMVRADRPPWMANRVDEYERICNEFGMDRDSEFSSLDGYLEDYRRSAEGVSAKLFENEIWRLVIVPKMDGTIVQLRHKPSNRDFLSAYGSPGIEIPNGAWRIDAYSGPHRLDIDFTDATVTGNTLTMTGALDDHAQLTNTITLTDKITQTLRLEHTGEDPKRYRLIVRPTLHIGVDYEFGKSPSAVTLTSRSRNHALRINYQPGQFTNPTIQQTIPQPDVPLELPTADITLEQGGVFEATLSLRYLQSQP